MGQQSPVLVTGASGKLGRLVLEELLSTRGVPAAGIIATTRSPATLADFARRGVDVRAADFDDPATLPAAFAGARRMLLISTTPEAPYVRLKRFRQQAAAIEAAVEAGVPHIIYTSAPNPEPGTPCFWKEDHHLTEQALMRSGVKWTILRNWEWPDWHLELTWLPALARGVRYTAAGDGRCAYQTREDFARAAAGALLSDDVADRRFDVTGPELLANDDIMTRLGEVAGQNIEVVKVSPDEYGRRLLDMGLDPNFVPIYVAFDTAVGMGLFDAVSSATETLSGRKPQTLREFFSEYGVRAHPAGAPRAIERET